MGENDSSADATNADSLPEPSEVEKESNGDPNAPLAEVPAWVQVVWVIVGLGLLWVHAYETETKVRDWNHPLADALTLAYVAFVLFGLLLHVVAEIGLPGGGKIRFRAEKSRESALESIAEYKLAAEVFAELLADWTQASASYNALLLRYGTDDTRVQQIVARFCIERMEQFRIYFSQPKEKMRLSVWFWIPDEVGLRLLLSEEIRDEETWNYLFEPMEGLLGQCFVENEEYQIKDVRQSVRFVPIRKKHEYKGLILIPFSAGSGFSPVGVLSIDSTLKGYVQPEVFNAAKALAQLVALAYSHPKAIAAHPKLGLKS